MTSHIHGTFTLPALAEGNKITASINENQQVDWHTQIIQRWATNVISAQDLEDNRQHSDGENRTRRIPGQKPRHQDWISAGRWRERKHSFWEGSAGPLINTFCYWAHTNPLLQMEPNGFFCCCCCSSSAHNLLFLEVRPTLVLTNYCAALLVKALSCLAERC